MSRFCRAGGNLGGYRGLLKGESIAVTRDVPARIVSAREALIECIHDWLRDDDTRHRVLVSNPHRLYWAD